MAESISMREAARRLGVSNTKIWRLVKNGVLTTHRNPLDSREKLIRVAELEKLMNLEQPRFVSDGIASNPNAVRSDRIEEDLKERWHTSC